MKKIVDEREELELLKVEHKGFWALFYGLVIVISLKTIFPEYNFITFYGVDILLFISSGIILIGCAKKGLWCYSIKPTNFSNVLFSIAGSILASVIIFLACVRNYAGKVNQLMMFCAVFAVVIFLLIFATLTIMKKIVLNRQKKFEESLEDDLDDK